MVVSVVAGALWAMVPAYVPNNVAVLAGGGRPLDGGRTLGGTRLLGDGKTWRGTAVGTAAGVVVAELLDLLNPLVAEAVGLANGTLPAFPPRVAVALALGAMLGDVGASFLKRRTGRERGAAVPGLDQLDFVVGALVLTALVAPTWFGEALTLPRIAVIVLVTPVLHLATNAVAYLVDLKDEPW